MCYKTTNQQQRNLKPIKYQATPSLNQKYVLLIKKGACNIQRIGLFGDIPLFSLC